jgi:hypothetical protein
MLIGCDRASTIAGNTDHGWLGCSATCPSQSKDRIEKTSLPDFSGSSSSG